MTENSAEPGVEKTFDVEEFAVPTVVYEIASDRDDVVGVSGLLVAGLLAAIGGRTVAVVPFLVGVLALCGWAYRARR